MSNSIKQKEIHKVTKNQMENIFKLNTPLKKNTDLLSIEFDIDADKDLYVVYDKITLTYEDANVKQLGKLQTAILVEIEDSYDDDGGFDRGIFGGNRMNNIASGGSKVYTYEYKLILTFENNILYLNSKDSIFMKYLIKFIPRNVPINITAARNFSSRLLAGINISFITRIRQILNFLITTVHVIKVHDNNSQPVDGHIEEGVSNEVNIPNPADGLNPVGGSDEGVNPNIDKGGKKKSRKKRQKKLKRKSYRKYNARKKTN